jgi:hypothetical protein
MRASPELMRAKPQLSSWMLAAALLGALSCATPSRDAPLAPAATSKPAAELSTPRRFVQRPGERDGFVEAQLPDDWRLAHAQASVTPLFDGLGVGLQRAGLFLGDDLLVPAADGRLIASASDNHLIVALHERVELLAPVLEQAAETRGEVWDGHANLYIDPDMQVGDLVDTIYTLGRSGFMSYQLAVTTDDHGEDAIRRGVLISPPKFYRTSESQRVIVDVTELFVALTSTEVTVARRRPGNVEIIEHFDRDEQAMARLTTLAAQEAERLRMIGSPVPRTVVFSAISTVTIGSLLEAMVAVSGPDCDSRRVGLNGGDPNACHFTTRVFEAGRG